MKNFRLHSKASKLFLAILLNFLLLLISSCDNMGAFPFLFNEDNVDERYGGFKQLSENEIPSLPSDTDGIYTGLIVTDVHFGGWGFDKEEKNRFLEWMEKQFQNEDKTKIPRFAICLGDSADGGHRSEYEEFNSYFEEIKSMAKKYLGSSYEFKVYTVLGNHDLYNNGWENWKKQVYPYTSSYFFTAKTDSSSAGISYYFLDSANGTLGKDQLNDFEKKIKNDKNPKLIFTHYPIYAGKSVQLVLLGDTIERNRCLSLFAKNNVKMVFGGHSHSNFSHDLNDFSQENTTALFRNGYCRLFTVNEKAGTVSTRLIEY
ncbi:MAG: metallophosphoesterase [Treponema sp.]|nr:metallophosphoesterase [Candidatus Treponema equifaecale]